MVRGREIVLKSLFLALFGLGWVGGLLLSKCSPVKKHPSVFTQDTGWGFVPVNTAGLRLSCLPGDIVQKRIRHHILIHVVLCTESRDTLLFSLLIPLSTVWRLHPLALSFYWCLATILSDYIMLVCGLLLDFPLADPIADHNTIQSRSQKQINISGILKETQCSHRHTELPEIVTSTVKC